MKNWVFPNFKNSIVYLAERNKLKNNSKSLLENLGKLENLNVKNLKKSFEGKSVSDIF